MYFNPEYIANVVMFLGLCIGFLDLSPLFGSDDTDDADTATPPEPEEVVTPELTPENNPLESYVAENFSQTETGTEAPDYLEALTSGALFGLEGDDQIQGSAENDHLEGDAGNDSMSAAEGDDFADGGSGNDTIYGMNGNDQVFGGLDDDLIEGNNGEDIVDGGDGNDTISGGAGLDALVGGAGDDLIASDRADNEADFTRGFGDSLNGGEGNDRLFFTNGDTVIGGTGEDTFHMVDVNTEADPNSAFILDFESGVDTIQVYYQPTVDKNGAQITPEIGTQIDSDSGWTTVFVNNIPVLVVNSAVGIATNDMQFVLPETLNIA